MAGRRSETQTHTSPCLKDHTDAWSPVRDTHKFPAYKTALVAGRWSERDTHKLPAYKTAQVAGRRSERHTHKSLPTRLHRWLVAGQRERERETHTSPCLQDGTDGWLPVRERDTHTLVPVYKTAQMAGRRSETHTHTSPCLQDRTEAGHRQRHTQTPYLQDRAGGRLLVRERDTHKLPAYKTAQVAGHWSETHTHTSPCLQDCTDGRSPVRDTDTHTSSCLQDRTDGWSPDRERHTHKLPAYKTAQVVGRWSERETHKNSLPTRLHRWPVAGQRHTHTLVPAYKTAQMAGRRSETHTHALVPAYKTAQMAGHRSETHKLEV